MAAVDLVVEHGYAAVTETDIIDRAGVTQEEFHRRFADKEACALDALELFFEEQVWRLESAYQSQPDWRSGLRAAAYEAADWLAEHPNAWRFSAVGLLEAKSEMIRVKREETLSYAARIFDRGRAAANRLDAIPEAAAMLAIGSIAQMLTHRVQRDGQVKISDEEVPELIYLVVRPYVGEVAAREELTAPRPPSWRS